MENWAIFFKTGIPMPQQLVYTVKREIGSRLTGCKWLVLLYGL
jgi:hypothetical protein